MVHNAVLYTGFIMSLWSMYENEQQSPSKDKISDYLSGNLCRCTGYRPILDAAQKLMTIHVLY